MASERFNFLLAVLVLLGCSLIAGAQGVAGQSDTLATPPPPPGASTTNSRGAALLKEVRQGVFELGDVRIDKQQRTVSFPARLNLADGPMEYFLVTSWGKTHESILRTETEPDRIHVAMLLLGAKGAATNSPSDNTLESGGFVSHPSSVPLSGDEVLLAIKWNAGGKQIVKQAEELVINRENKTILPKGSWTYNGSRVVQGTFLAEAGGSIVSLITDGAALINNTGPGHDNDAIWIANTNNLPPADLVVEVTIQLNNTPSRR